MTPASHDFLILASDLFLIALVILFFLGVSASIRNDRGKRG